MNYLTKEVIFFTDIIVKIDKIKLNTKIILSNDKILNLKKYKNVKKVSHFNVHFFILFEGL